MTACPSPQASSGRRRDPAVAEAAGRWRVPPFRPRPSIEVSGEAPPSRRGGAPPRIHSVALDEASPSGGGTRTTPPLTAAATPPRPPPCASPAPRRGSRPRYISRLASPHALHRDGATGVADCCRDSGVHRARPPTPRGRSAAIGDLTTAPARPPRPRSHDARLGHGLGRPGPPLPSPRRRALPRTTAPPSSSPRPHPSAAAILGRERDPRIASCRGLGPPGRAALGRRGRLRPPTAAVAEGCNATFRNRVPRPVLDSPVSVTTGLETGVIGLETGGHRSRDR